jgi:hypothetical protein
VQESELAESDQLLCFGAVGLGNRLLARHTDNAQYCQQNNECRRDNYAPPPRAPFGMGGHGGGKGLLGNGETTRVPLPP